MVEQNIIRLILNVTSNSAVSLRSCSLPVIIRDSYLFLFVFKNCKIDYLCKTYKLCWNVPELWCFFFITCFFWKSVLEWSLRVRPWPVNSRFWQWRIRDYLSKAATSFFFRYVALGYILQSTSFSVSNIQQYQANNFQIRYRKITYVSRVPFGTRGKVS